MSLLIYQYFNFIFSCCTNAKKKSLYLNLTSEFSKKLDIKSFLTNISFVNKIIKVLFTSTQINTIKRMLEDDLTKLNKENDW